jgi:hypothetical protein
MFLVDADEFFYCPQASASISTQRLYQQRIHNEFIAKGIEEMRYVRIPYSGLAPKGMMILNSQNRSTIEFTNHTGHCLISAFDNNGDLYDFFSCWSKGSSYDNFAKSADMASICPFHYNHWSCDGMKGGGRDFTKIRLLLCFFVWFSSLSLSLLDSLWCLFILFLPSLVSIGVGVKSH